MGGTFLANPPAWLVPAETPEGEGSLFIVLDRTLLTNDLTMELTLADTQGSSLYLDLLATNMATVGTNLYGNLIEGSNEVVCLELPLPLTSYPSASIIRLWRGKGKILVYESALFESSVAGVALSARGAPADDAESPVAWGGLSCLARRSVLAEVGVGRGGDPGASVTLPERIGPRMIHVNAKAGDDACDGRALARSGTSGPKRTIPAALGIAEDGDAITVAPGTYDGNVSFCGKNVDVFMTGDVTLQ